MKVYNLPVELQSFINNVFLNESCSLVKVEIVEGIVDAKLPFCAFVNNDFFAINLIKSVIVGDGKLVVFDANPKFVMQLIENNVWKDNILLVGVQNFSESELNFLISNNVKFYSMKEICVDSKEEVCDAVMFVCKDSSRFHLHVNESVLNSAGLSLRELLYFIQRFRVLKGLKSVTLRTDCKDLCVSLKVMTELF